MAKADLMIDAGHGGKDGGGGTNNLWKESNKVLEISKYQYDRFKELGVKVEMTRTTDIYIGNTERTNIIKQSGAKYCISNHINAGGGQGAETIHSIHSDGSFAKALADGLKEEGQNIRRVFTRRYPDTTDLDYYFMHRETGSVETVIVEYGFADNDTDTQRITDNWKAYAEGVVKAHCEYTGVKYTKPDDNTKKPKDKPDKKPVEDKEYTGNSIVDYLNSKEIDSSKSNREKLAKEYNVSGYDLSAEKNLELLNAMKKGKPKPSISKGDMQTSSIVDYLKSIGESSGEANRKKLALEYGVSGYDLSAKKNTELLNAMRSGKPVSKSYSVGNKVKIKSNAGKYSRSTYDIPNKHKNKYYTIQQVGSKDVLIKELYSWVYNNDLI